MAGVKVGLFTIHDDNLSYLSQSQIDFNTFKTATRFFFCLSTGNTFFFINRQLFLILTYTLFL